MSKDVGYFVSIKDGEHGDTKAFIRSALEHPMISRWAYILHDKEIYNDFDMASRPYGLRYNWASGFEGMEKYASCDEYVEEMMKAPPYVGDKLDSYWRIVCFVDKKCYDKDIEEIFGITSSPYPDFLNGRHRIAARLKYLTREDSSSVAEGRHHYSDEEVKSNFDFREYLDNTGEYTRWERFKDAIRPAPMRARRRSW